MLDFLFPNEGEGFEPLSGGSDGEVSLKKFVGVEAVGCGSSRGVEGDTGNFFAVNVDRGTLADFEVEFCVEGAEGFVAGDLFTNADGNGCEAGVEGLDDVPVGEAVAEENGFSGVAGGFAGVEHKSVAAGDGSGDSVEVSGGGKAKAFHGAQLAEVGFEFGGPIFGFFFVLVLDGDGISGDGICFLGEAEGVGVVFYGILEEVDPKGHEDEPEKDHGGNDDVGAANLHGDTFRCGLGYRKHEVREI